jgi:hypothetical protein
MCCSGSIYTGQRRGSPHPEALEAPLRSRTTSIRCREPWQGRVRVDGYRVGVTETGSSPCGEVFSLFLALTVVEGLVPVLKLGGSTRLPIGTRCKRITRRLH